MKKEKALDVIKRQIDCYSNEEDKCIAVRTCGDCKYNATVEEIIEALQMAISALEKQEKKPAKAKFNKRYNKFVYFCPVCGEVTGHYDYCSDCGQAIDYDNSEPYTEEDNE